MDQVKTNCWHCHQEVRMDNAKFKDINGTTYPFFPCPIDESFKPDKDSIFKIYTCCNCGYPNIAEYKARTIKLDLNLDIVDPENITMVRWIPFKLTSKSYDKYEELPEYVKSSAVDAHVCFEVGVYSGAILLTRRALECLLKFEVSRLPEKDRIPEHKPLIAFLTLLINKKILPPYYEETASAIRFFGNDVAHKTDFDFAKNDSENLLFFLDSIIDELYGEKREWANKVLESHNAARKESMKK